MMLRAALALAITFAASYVAGYWVLGPLIQGCPAFTPIQACLERNHNK